MQYNKTTNLTNNINPTMQDVVNNLIQLDLNSAYLYLAMSNYLTRIGLIGFGQYLRAQYNEELNHANKLMKYLIDRGGLVEIREIQSKPSSFGTPLETFKVVLEHEQMVTRTYKRALEIAQNENDVQSQIIFRNFIFEQVDEEAFPAEIINKLQMAGGNNAAILLLDQQYGQMAELPKATG